MPVLAKKLKSPLKHDREIKAKINKLEFYTFLKIFEIRQFAGSVVKFGTKIISTWVLVKSGI
jgi:hypothetical protein